MKDLAFICFPWIYQSGGRENKHTQTLAVTALKQSQQTLSERDCAHTQAQAHRPETQRLWRPRPRTVGSVRE